MKKNNKGFTLAELLIVVAIIAVLVAIAIPVFTTQLEKSREATDMSNIRAAVAEVTTQYLADGAQSSYSATVTAQQKQSGWQNSNNGTLYTRVDGSEKSITVTAKKSGTYTIKINKSGSITVS